MRLGKLPEGGGLSLELLLELLILRLKLMICASLLAISLV